MNFTIQSRRFQGPRERVRESLVVPCFNEGDNIRRLGERLREITEKRQGLEVILVDNGSTDATREELILLSEENPSVRVVCVETNIGYGNGIKAGLRYAKGSAIGWTHADLQTDPEDAAVAFNLHQGDRKAFVKGKRTGRAWGDHLFSAGMGIFASMIFGLRLQEINAQPTVCGASMRQKLLAGPDDFSFDLFALVSARRMELNELRFPVFFRARYAGTSSWNVSLSSRWRLVARTMRYCFRLRKELHDDDNH